VKFVKIAAALLAVLITTAAQAQDVTLIVPFPPKGVTDVMARLVATHLSQSWGHAVNVVNVPGEGATVGTLQVLRAKPDGAVMMMNATGQATQNPAIDSKLPYRWDEPALIARVSATPLVFVVRGDSKWTDLKSVLADIKRDPAQYRYGTSGSGGAGRIVLARLLDTGGIEWTKVGAVTFQGGAAILEALVAGKTDIAAQYLAEMKGLLADRKVKPLAVSTPARATALPQVPTGAEAGFPAFNLVGWTGIAGPPGLPDAVIRRWDDAIRALCADPAFRGELAALSAEPAYLGPAEFKAALKKEYEEALASAEKLGLRK